MKKLNSHLYNKQQKSIWRDKTYLMNALKVSEPQQNIGEHKTNSFKVVPYTSSTEALRQGDDTCGTQQPTVGAAFYCKDQEKSSSSASSLLAKKSTRMRG